MTARRRRKPLTKRQCEAIHAKRRARARLGLKWNRHDLRRLVGRIQAGDVTHSERVSGTRTLHWMDIDGENVTVVYDRKRQMIVSVWKTKGLER